MFRNRSDAPRVNLERELIFTYSDFNDENFMFNTDSEGRLRLYLIDFEHASFLPPSFLAFAILRDNHWWTTRDIAERIGTTLRQANLEALGHASCMFHALWANAGLFKTSTGWSLTPDAA